MSSTLSHARLRPRFDIRWMRVLGRIADRPLLDVHDNGQNVRAGRRAVSQHSAVLDDADEAGTTKFPKWIAYAAAPQNGDMIGPHSGSADMAS